MRRESPKPLKVRSAPFALRMVQRAEGKAAILYRRETVGRARSDRLKRVGAVSPLALVAGERLLREGVRAAVGPKAQLSVGPFHPLDADWGARIACYAYVAAGLRDGERLHTAASRLANTDGSEAAWWLGLMQGAAGSRAVRALRVLTEAVG